MRANSIKTRLIVAVSGLMIALVVVLSLSTFAYYERKSKELIANAQFAMVSLLAAEIDERLASAHEQLITLSTLVRPEHLRDPEKAQAFLDAYVRPYAVFGNGIILFNRDAIMLGAAPQSQYRGQSFKFREYMAATFESKKPYLGVYRSSRAHRHPALMLTAPIFDAPGNIIGVLTGSIDLLNDNVLGRFTRMHSSKTGYFYVVTRDRTLVVHPEPDRIFEQVPAGANKLLDRVATEGFEGTDETVNSRGLAAITSFKKLRTKDWFVAANFPKAEAYAPILEARRTLLVMMIVTALVLPLIVWSLMNSITRPLLAFTRHVQSMPEKTGAARLYQVRSHDEIGRLTQAFDAMVTSLDHQRDEIEAQRERLAVTLRSIADGVIVTDLEGRVVLINRAAERLTGWAQDEAIGAALHDILVIHDEKTHLRIADPVTAAIANASVVTLPSDSVLVARDGARRFIADSCAPVKDSSSRTIGAVFVFQDITERRVVEEQRTRADKLESVGLLAGGIAHDYNNILTVILANVSLAQLAPQGSPEVPALHESIEQAALQARDLGQQLLTFSKGGSPVKRTSSVAELVEQSVSLALRGSNVRADLSCERGLWLVDVDRGQIHQVLNNLAINAKQAMPDGGILEVRAENCTLKESELELPRGRYVKISLRDTGIGIAPENLPKIFDPYFTTKTEGTGLGLATAYSVVRKHHGNIAVHSAAGAGTTFEIYLPASEKEQAEQATGIGPVRKGTGSILVMDDDAAVRGTLARILPTLGYTVECVHDGSAAVRRYAEAMGKGKPFDLLLMDLTIPGGMGGKEAMQHLKRLYPGVKVIVSSGYSNDPVLASYQDYGFAAVVLKPFRVSELSEQIDDVMRRRVEA